MNEHEQRPRLLRNRFGPDWSGRRCGARTRAGTPCQNPCIAGRPRCRLHGGNGGAPSGEKNGNYKRGVYTRERQEGHKKSMERIDEFYRFGRRAGLWK